MGSARAFDVMKGYVDTDYGQIHYRRCGQGMPSVLLLHAAPQSSSMFSSALKRLAARGLHAIAVDLPNCGESSRSPAELKIADVAEIVLQAIQGLRFTTTVDIIGHQTGATVALHIASELPQLVRRLVLWGVPMLGFMERGDVLREEPPDYNGDLVGTVGSFLETRYPHPVPWQLKVRTLIDVLQTYERRPWLTRAMAVVDHESLLRSLPMPVLCLAGDNEPLQKATMKAALLCCNGKYVNLGSAGSDVVDEIPDDYVAEVFAFLMEGEDGGGGAAGGGVGGAGRGAGGVGRGGGMGGGGVGERASWSIQSEVVPPELGRKMSATAAGMAAAGGGGGGGGGGNQLTGQGSLPSSRLGAGAAGGGGAGAGDGELHSPRFDSVRSGEGDERRSSTEKKKGLLKGLFRGKSGQQ